MDKEDKPTGRPPKYGKSKPHNITIRVSEETYSWLKEHYRGGMADLLEKIARGEITIEEGKDIKDET